ncbi:MAG: hydroxyacid dehydrogenase [Alicyclobacillus sp.]|nr:hydroxyacid dehydrogenase [Alicyclobacillus sp.]
MKVLVVEALGCPVPAWFAQKYDVSTDPGLAADRSRLLAQVANATALVVRNHVQVDRELLAAAPRLRVVGRLGVGLDNIDLAACQERGVEVVWARGENAVAVAEYVLAAMLDHARFLRWTDALCRAGRWDRAAGTGRELAGKTLGLLGFGDIAQRVAVRARAFGMQVLAHDPLAPPHSVWTGDFHVQPVDLQTLCRSADYLSLHVPLTPATYHLLGARELAWLKPQAVLIQTARGGVVDEQALYEALRQAPDRRAVLDVREQEPPPADDPLRNLPQVLLTPHIAGLTEESVQRVARAVLCGIDRVLRSSPGES